MHQDLKMSTSMTQATHPIWDMVLTMNAASPLMVHRVRALLIQSHTTDDGVDDDAQGVLLIPSYATDVEIAAEAHGITFTQPSSTSTASAANAKDIAFIQQSIAGAEITHAVCSKMEENYTSERAPTGCHKCS